MVPDGHVLKYSCILEVGVLALEEEVWCVMPSGCVDGLMWSCMLRPNVPPGSQIRGAVAPRAPLGVGELACVSCSWMCFLLKYFVSRGCFSCPGCYN